MHQLTRLGCLLNVEIVKMLMKAGADVNAVDDENYSILDIAILWAPHTEHTSTIIKLLKQAGAKFSEDL